MKKFLITIFVVILGGFYNSCEHEQLTPDDRQMKEIHLSPVAKQIVEKDNQFGFELFHNLTETEQEVKNTMISPVSVALALAMTYNGATDSTKKAMENTLNLEGLTTEQINQSYKDLMEALLSVDQKVTVEMANSIWSKQGFTVEDEFIKVNGDYYNAEVRELDFSDPIAKDIINGWISDKTHGKIQDVIESIEPSVVMYLINALYFNGFWKYQFDESDTKTEPFYTVDGSEVQTDMMQMEADLKYYRDERFEAIELPYGRGNYSMICLLPDAGYSVNELIMDLSVSRWNEMLYGWTEKGIQLHLPKLKFEYKKELKEILTSLGMGIAFTPEEADFSGINPLKELFISKVIHQTFLEVDEKGTEAAAVTVVEIRETSSGGSGSPYRIRFDRPFLFAIQENSTKTIMFMGKVINPA
ncbi:MAG: serpin family protein [Bacteroidota bacterium]